MSEKVCAVCGNKVGMGSYKIANGLRACSKCMKKAGYGMTTSYNVIRSLTVEDLNRDAKAEKKAAQQETAERFKEFNADLTIGNVLFVDQKKRQFRIKGFANIIKIYALDSINGYEVIENGESVTSGGLGRAAVGAVAFGGIGAVVGAVTGKKKSRSVIDTLKIKINMNDLENPVVYIDLIKSKVKRNSSMYKTAIEQADKIISTLEILLKDQQVNEPDHSSPISTADELRKFKELLDDGIITQEEFDAKKKDLLGL